MSASAAGPGAGTYRLVNAAGGTCLEVPSGSTADGVQLALAACDGGADQSWELAGSGDGFTVRSSATGLCVGVRGDSASAGKAVQQQRCGTGPSQVWKVGSLGDAAHHLINAHSEKCLNPKSGLLQQNSCDKAAGKSWTLQEVDGSTPPATPTASATASPSASAPAASPSAPASPSAGATAPADDEPSGGTGLASWPTATDEQPVSSTIEVSGEYDGSLKRFHGSGDLGGSGQGEGQDPLFELADGATLKNVILGSPAADGVHCTGSCTLVNVWWEDVGEDAASFKGKSAAAQYEVIGGGARKADDKVFQHNGAGTLTIRDFQVSDFGKLYRSCGNCGTQYQRHVVIDDVLVTGPGKVLAGVNANYGDTATLSGVRIAGDTKKKIVVCERFEGNDSGDEPTALGSGPDGKSCLYEESDVTYQ
ncbi:pectate lyase [Streptomyces sp. Tu 3180]|nr:pectate lyase [Streptomyces sp. Tu 3180]